MSAYLLRESLLNPLYGGLAKCEVMCDVPLRFYGGMLILVCLLYVAPVGWVLAGLNSTVFLWNRHFYRG